MLTKASFYGIYAYILSKCFAEGLKNFILFPRPFTVGSLGRSKHPLLGGILDKTDRITEMMVLRTIGT
jgi:hypothetical protein